MKLERTFQFPLPLFAVLPLVNVLFLILVFFTMTSRFVLEPGVQVILPQTIFAVEPQQHAEIVSVTAAPAPAIYFHGQRVTMEELGALLDRNQAADRKLILKADQDTPSGLCHAIMDEALRRGYPVILAGQIAPR